MRPISEPRKALKPWFIYLDGDRVRGSHPGLPPPEGGPLQQPQIFLGQLPLVESNTLASCPFRTLLLEALTDLRLRVKEFLPALMAPSLESRLI